FRDQQGTVTHLEVAIKFFLLHAESTASDEIRLDQFIGPNPKDNFDSKLTHMVSQQLQLGSKTGFQIEKKRILVRGYLFYPGVEPKEQSGINLPPLIRRDHASGTWCRIGKIEEHLAGLCAARYWIVPKPHWLAAYQPSPMDQFEATRFAEVIEERFRNGASAIYFQSVNVDGQVGRHFVVPDCWPEVTSRGQRGGSN
ncbi:MAG: DUF1853 family protein, partial [Planctomycetota bacterium]